MVTKNQIKLVVNLKQKKYRSQHTMFVVEGEKLVKELLQAGVPSFQIFVDGTWKGSGLEETELVPKTVLKQMSSLKQPNGVLGVFHIPEPKKNEESDWVVALDAVRDPGNLGTIIRLCDWFGIKQLVCSADTVDCYNPKVLQATMGSIARVNVVYTDLPDFLSKASSTVYGAFMDGGPIYGKELPKKGILVMGNEANGISDKVSTWITERISIPQFGGETAESLNVATATAILLNEIRR